MIVAGTLTNKMAPALRKVRRWRLWLFWGWFGAVLRGIGRCERAF
jgi:hypothetical protein